MKDNEKILWTRHAQDKLRYYRLSESRVKRIIRHPTRTEEGILEGAVACMQPSDGKKYSEIWTMYVLVSDVALGNSPRRHAKMFASKANPGAIFNGSQECSPKSPAEAKRWASAQRGIFLRVRSRSPRFQRGTMPGDGSSRLRGSSRVLTRPHEGLLGELPRPHQSFSDGTKKIKIITAWRYPGKSPARDPIPAEILREIKNLL